MKTISIAIDGGAGTGKGTTAKGVATALNYAYVDTGAMYRAVTLWLHYHELVNAPEETIAHRLGEIDIRFGRGEYEGNVYLNNEDVTDAIRIPVVNEYVACISAFLSVRSFLRAQQKAMAMNGAVVMDGRDMGSVVIPDAELKVFLECSLDERARRRYTEMQAKGVEISLESVKKNILERDQIDYTGDTPTSEKAPDARVLDTTHLTIEEQIAVVVAWAREIIG